MRQKAFQTIILLPGIILLLAVADRSNETPVQPILILTGNNSFGIYAGKRLFFQNCF